MKVLSIIAGLHAGGIVYGEDNKIICHYEEERYSRVKNGMNLHENWEAYPIGAVQRFKQDFGINHFDVILYSDMNTKKIDNMINLFGFSCNKKIAYSHYIGHAASAYFQSGFSDETLVICLDGVGNDENGTLKRGAYYIGNNGKLELKLYIDHNRLSFGQYYAALTEVLGFKRTKDEGKITGMSPHGITCTDQWAREELIKVFEDNLVIDGCTTGIETIPQHQKMHSDILGIFQNLSFRGDTYTCLIANCGQKVFENQIVKYIKNIHSNYPYIKKLALAGGVFANVALNKRINEMDEFDEVFIAPQMGDEGVGLGLVLNYFGENNNLKPYKVKNVYLGTIASDDENKKSFNDPLLNYTIYSPEIVAKLLNYGKIIGICQGASESGPRSLGNRSIIANPADKDVVNKLTKILRRNKFMPFAPTVLSEFANQVFDIKKSSHTAEFMTMCYDTKQEWIDKIPAVLHQIDKTARPQVLNRETNPDYYDIISEFYKLSGIPLVLNTSFNVHDEPIIDINDHAINHLKSGVIDFLIIKPFIIGRKFF